MFTDNCLLTNILQNIFFYAQHKETREFEEIMCITFFLLGEITMNILLKNVLIVMLIANFTNTLLKSKLPVKRC